MAKKTQHVAGSHIVETQKLYEIMLVIKPDTLESALEKKLKEFEAFLAENKGTVDIRDIWGKRDLAYRIKKYEQAIYVVYNVTLPSTFLQELDEHLRIHNDVMRYLVVSLKKGYTYKKPSDEPVTQEEKEDDKKTSSSKTTSYKSDSQKKADKNVKEDSKEKKEKKEGDSKSLDDKLSSILNDDELKI